MGAPLCTPISMATEGRPRRDALTAFKVTLLPSSMMALGSNSISHLANVASNHLYKNHSNSLTTPPSRGSFERAGGFICCRFSDILHLQIQEEHNAPSQAEVYR